MSIMDTDTMHFKKGFTIVELIVVIAIILLLLSIVLASIMLARQDGRDKRRVSDLSNIAHAMTLYKEKHREYPDAGTGIEIGKRTTASERALDDEIKALNGNTYSDPLGGSGYGYVFYSRFFCGGERVNMVVVKKMEK